MWSGSTPHPHHVNKTCTSCSYAIPQGMISRPNTYSCCSMLTLHLLFRWLSKRNLQKFTYKKEVTGVLNSLHAGISYMQTFYCMFVLPLSEVDHLLTCKTTWGSWILCSLDRMWILLSLLLWKFIARGAVGLRVPNSILLAGLCSFVALRPQWKALIRARLTLARSLVNSSGLVRREV